MTRSAEITISGGDIRDLDEVMRVMDDSFDPMFGEAWTAAQCAGLFPMPGVWLSLARERDGAVTGFALARVVATEAELLLLAVKNDAQRRGVGHALVQRFFDDSKARGADKLFLEVRDGNPAVRLYNAFGFKEIGRRPKYYTGRDGQIYDALTLQKSVAP